jgi:hypothetical protein
MSNSNQKHPDAGEEETSSKVEVRGSGRAIFTLVHMVFNLIDDELTVLDAQKCAGKKVDMGKRAIRLATGAINRGSVAQEKLGGFCINLDLLGNCTDYVP